MRAAWKQQRQAVRHLSRSYSRHGGLSARPSSCSSSCSSSSSFPSSRSVFHPTLLLPCSPTCPPSFSTSTARPAPEPAPEPAPAPTPPIAPAPAPAPASTLPSATPVASSLRPDSHHIDHLAAQARKLPLSCPGCGAPSQILASDQAGYYSLGRSAVKNYIHQDAKQDDRLVDDVLATVDAKLLTELGLAGPANADKQVASPSTPICDRCHNLIHHSGTSTEPIHHPSIDTIQSIIKESPHKQNHIYHIIDAADFPLSLIPNLQHALDLPRLRTQNRRSKTRTYHHGRVAEVSFIITRSDLLAPKKEMVDAMMPYLRESLRDALGRSAKNIRLGNLRCVSAKRGWWTKEVKEDIWKRGGAAWMVGKVNVGKSSVFELVYPKGRASDAPNLNNLRQAQLLGGAAAALGDAGTEDVKPALSNLDTAPSPSTADTALDEHLGDPEELTTPDLSQGGALADLPNDLEMESPPLTTTLQETAQDNLDNQLFEDEDDDDFSSLLPPPQKETQYPVMPIISSLPGTTASPIRIPFGNGKGELIDLPGVSRTLIDQYVDPSHRQDIIMKSRITPEQHTLKPGQSLLLGGGLVRITPTTPDLVFLTYPFLTLHPHITATAKAEAVQAGERASGIPTIVAEGVLGEKIKSAGKFKLKWDVTKKRAGPLTSTTAVKLKPEQLPFIVYSADVLVEGVGWIEVVAQVRKVKKRTTPSRMEQTTNPASVDTPREEAEPDSSNTTTYKPLLSADADIVEVEEKDLIPEIEIFTPEGKFVATRPPMNAWLLGGKKPATANARKSRPRKSMKSMKGSSEGRKMAAIG